MNPVLAFGEDEFGLSLRTAVKSMASHWIVLKLMRT
jgi:hypothetical protein